MSHDPDVTSVIDLDLAWHSENRFALPAIMSEGFVSLGHAVHVLLLFHSAAAAVGSVHNFSGQLVGHGLATASPRIKNQPMNRQRLPAKWIHFHWNLVIRTTHAP